jgi:hypothetical protein
MKSVRRNLCMESCVENEWWPPIAPEASAKRAIAMDDSRKERTPIAVPQWGCVHSNNTGESVEKKVQGKQRLKTHPQRRKNGRSQERAITASAASTKRVIAMDDFRTERTPIAVLQWGCVHFNNAGVKVSRKKFRESKDSKRTRRRKNGLSQERPQRPEGLKRKT